MATIVPVGLVVHQKRDFASILCCRSYQIYENAIETPGTSSARKHLFKLLLLGPGESGKTTFVKQIQIIHLNEFTEEEIELKKRQIHYQIQSDMLELVKNMSLLGLTYTQEYLKSEAKRLEKHMSYEYQDLTEEIKIIIKNLWADEGVQECYRRKDEFQLSDSAKHFFDSIDRIADPNYRPTNEDILRLRVMTVGVNIVEFSHTDSEFRMYDAGGQRTQRRKWIHFFDDISALIFIAAISEYTQKLREDQTKNRMLETLELFKDVVNHQAFANAAIILFLNKIDIFREKLKQTPLTTLFPSYEGGDDYHQAVEYIKAKFHRRYENKSMLYIYETCATDTNQIRKVSDGVFKSIIDKKIKNVGLLQ